MKRVLTSLVLIPVVLAIVFLGPRWLFTLAAAAIAILAAWEYLGLAKLCGANPPRVAVLVAVALLFAVSFEWADQTLAAVGLLSLGIFVYSTFSRPPERVTADASTAVFGLLYVGFTMVALPALREETNGPSLVAFLLCTVWAGDIAALYVGRLLGRHKLAPTLSPKKTWEGSIGSLVGSLLATGALLGLANLLDSWNSARLSFPEETWYWLMLAALVNIAAQIGDLAESALKRSAGVKDSGDLIPGHGGVLDRIDAMLLAAPVLWYAQVIHQRF